MCIVAGVGALRLRVPGLLVGARIPERTVCGEWSGGTLFEGSIRGGLVAEGGAWIGSAVCLFGTG